METSERIEEINRFLQFVMMEWPETRPQVIDELARRCSNCILSERYIALEDGICQLCRQFQAAPQHPQARLGSDENELAHVLQDAVGRGPDHYDAVVLFSGGKDSAFLLHRLQSQYPKLRLAALTVDNGFMSQVALANCRQVLDALDKIRQSSQGNEESQAVGIDHFIVRPKPDLYKRAFRYALTHVGSEGCYSTVDRMDGDL
ncbi:MAG: hypothetical protein ACTHK7_13215, partial [Aureliella sp.]